MENTDMIEQIKNQITNEYPEFIEDGELETGTEEWLELLQLTLKLYGIDVKDPYDMLNMENMPYWKEIDKLGYTYVINLQIALDELKIDLI